MGRGRGEGGLLALLLPAVAAGEEVGRYSGRGEKSQLSRKEVGGRRWMGKKE